MITLVFILECGNILRSGEYLIGILLVLILVIYLPLKKHKKVPAW